MSGHPAPEMVSDSLYGLLSDEEDAVVHDHLDGCAECAVFAGRVKVERARLREALAPELPEGLRERLLARTPVRVRRGPAAWWPVAAAAAVFFAVVAVLLVRPAPLETGSLSAPKTRTFPPEEKIVDPSPEALKYAVLLKAARFSLADAIRSALLEAGGGAAIDAGLEDEDGTVVYAVDVAKDDKTVEIGLDAKTGALVEKKTEDDDHSRLARAFKTPLADLIENALRSVPGTAVAAELEIEKGRAEVHLTIVSEGRVRWVAFDATSGAILKEQEAGKKNKEEKR